MSGVSSAWSPATMRCSVMAATALEELLCKLPKRHYADPAIGQRAPLVSIQRPCWLERNAPSISSCVFTPSANDGEAVLSRIAFAQARSSNAVGWTR